MLHPSPNENTPNRNRMKGKVIIASGAGSVGDGWGNGKAASFVYGKEGGTVLCVDYRSDAAEETAELINKSGGQASAFECDVTDETSVDDMIKTCINRYGKIDVLHNNVGGQGTGRALDTISVADWNATFTRNITSAMLTCRAVAPIMAEEGGGAIVNIASIAGIRHLNVPTAVYSATKGAMIEFNRNIALQLAPRGIRANCVLPGYIDTPFIRRLVDGKPAYEYKGFSTAEEYCAARNSIIPTRRMGTGFDVAYASLFLASDEATHITATELIVDGGVTQTCPGV